MIFDYSALEGRIKEYGYTQKTFASKIRMSPATLSQKLGSSAFFKQKEIVTICRILKIAKKDIGKFFYTVKV